MISSKILIVTPNSDTAMRLLGWFAKGGAYVAFEGDAGRVREAITAGKPDCLILDDGIAANVLPTLIAQVKKESASIQVVAMGNFTEEQEIALFKSGADEVLLKPLRTGSLMYRLHRFMKK